MRSVEAPPGEPGKKRLALYVLTDLPHPPRSGNHLRYLQNLRVLSELGFDVTVVAGAVRQDASSAGVGDSATVARIVPVPPMATTSVARARRVLSLVAGAAGVTSVDPFGIEFRRRGLDSAVLEVAWELRPEVVVLRSLFADLAPQLQRSGAAVVIDAHDASPLMAEVLRAEARGLAKAGLALRRRASERADRCLRHADELWVPSYREIDYFRPRVNGVPIILVPNGTEVPAMAAVSPPSDELLLVGNFGWPPNLAAADVLVEKILPLVSAERPEAFVTLVGRNLPTERLARWRARSVKWEGAVTDVTPYFRRAGAFVFLPPPSARTPMPLKIAEALSYATPVAVSRGSTGGFDIRPGEDAIVTDDPEEIAGAVVTVLSDPEYRERLAIAGHRWARENLSREALRSRLERHSAIFGRGARGSIHGLSVVPAPDRSAE
jgi:glycosyltransferase involved in cell wall biosynthesis